MWLAVARRFRPAAGCRGGAGGGAGGAAPRGCPWRRVWLCGVSCEMAAPVVARRAYAVAGMGWTRCGAKAFVRVFSSSFFRFFPLRIPVFVRLFSLRARFGWQSACLVGAFSSSPRRAALWRVLRFSLNIIRIILIKNARVRFFPSRFPFFLFSGVLLLFRSFRPFSAPVRPKIGVFGLFGLTCVNFGRFFAFFIKFFPGFLGGFVKSVYLCTRFSAKRLAAGREGLR